MNIGKIKKILTQVLVICLLPACGHAIMRGSVAMKVGDDLAHVCLGENEVDVGDRVVLFQNECVLARGNPDAQSQAYGKGCRKVPIGGGQVVEVLNEHYSVIRVDPGVSYVEGTIVETK